MDFDEYVLDFFTFCVHYIFISILSSFVQDIGYIGTSSYPNNSVIAIDNIGEDSGGLFCYTDLATCCRESDSSNGAQGNWRFPNKTAVSSRSLSPHSFSRTRDNSVIILHRGILGVEPYGIYTCEIPNRNGTVQQVFFGIYTTGKGIN